jgi:hypothetical protein
MLEVFFFSKNKNFHGNFPEAGRFRELDCMQYELKRSNQCMRMESTFLICKKKLISKRKAV